jgi:hypothetical protein
MCKHLQKTRYLHERKKIHSISAIAVESVHKSSDSDSSIFITSDYDSDSDSSIFKTPDSDSFVKAQYVLIMVNLQDISSPPRESSGYFFDL